MITSFLSTESRKAWVAGVLSALLTPVLDLLSGTGVITIRTLVVAAISGVLAAAAVWATRNADTRPSVSESVDEAATPTPASAPVAAAQPSVSPHPTTLDLPSEDFSGQTVSE